jgi:hypothetical protein
MSRLKTESPERADTSTTSNRAAPSVGVVAAVYKEELQIEGLLRSLKAQTTRLLGVNAVDDGSTVARFAPRLLPELLRVSPVVLLSLVATGWGAWREWRSLRTAGQDVPADGFRMAGEPWPESHPGYSRQRTAPS